MIPLGVQRGVVLLVPHNPAWKDLFEAEKALLQAALGAAVLDIQHVGSTAILDLPAKPILDIAIAVRDFDEARVCIQPIEQLGYEYRGENGIPRRHFFAKGNPRTHHIHINEIDGPEWRSQILFRDYLRQHPHVVRQYAELKLALAQQYPTDRPAYTEAKAPFIQQVLALARSDTKGDQDDTSRSPSPEHST